MHTENANSDNAFDLLPLPEMIANIASAFVPALSAVVNTAR